MAASPASSSSSGSSSRTRTPTQLDQELLEKRVRQLLYAHASIAVQQDSVLLELWKEEHVTYLERGLDSLPAPFHVLDASRPWLCYWILHALALIGEPLNLQFSERTIDFLQRCQHPTGGYGGGPGQIPHLATTYAAVLALITLGGETALASIQREKLLQFLLRMKDPSGGFLMHEQGEIDVRGCYTALAVCVLSVLLTVRFDRFKVAHLLNLMVPELLENVGSILPAAKVMKVALGANLVRKLMEAALILANRVEVLDLPSLLHWVVFRQAKVEGGFQGRTNKLVDGCYSFWQGGIFALLQQLMPQLIDQQCSLYKGPIESLESVGEVEKPQEAQVSTAAKTHAHDERQRRAFWAACQDLNDVVTDQAEVTAEGLFPVLDTTIERPASFARCEEVDFSHDQEIQQSSTDDRMGEASSSSPCLNEELRYGPLFNTRALQGYILLCTQVLEGGLRDKPGKARDFYHTCYCLSGLSVAQYGGSRSLSALPPPRSVLGPYKNLLDSIHPVCNVKLDRYYEARDYFRKF